MVFSSVLFLFLFFPVVLFGYFLIRTESRNTWLLFASVVFYAWGEVFFSVVMGLSILLNYAFGLWVGACRTPRQARLVLALTVLINIGMLAWYKYANFLVANLNGLLSLLGSAPIPWTPIHLPIGISFFTFQALSYVFDVYRGQAEVQRNPFLLALYISLFPQLIAGPIVRYADVAEQIVNRAVTLDKFAYGIQRFLIGLSKKVLIANSVAVVADEIFAIPATGLTPGLAWLGILCYTLQIYFDFSGYSDMAIGLGHMFGFRFLENFDYPYIAQSIREFWRRWHISLSTWFRDYLYIPLGGNRNTPARVYLNLLTVFFLCGLWHGASWTFVVWGLFHGTFLVIERLGFAAWLAARVAVVRHAYVLLVVMVGWVLFRADSLSYALVFLSVMAGFGQGDGVEYHVGLYFNAKVALALVAGGIGSTPVLPFMRERWEQRLAAISPRHALLLEGMYSCGTIVGLGLLFLGTTMALTAGSHNPFIYFRF